MNRLFPIAAIFFSSLLPLAQIVSAEASKPNIIWILAEDHGPHLGCYGDTYATTPNLDAFAQRAYR